MIVREQKLLNGFHPLYFYECFPTDTALSFNV